MPGAYGDLLGRYFGLPSVPALVMLPAPSAPFVATRITCARGQLGMKQEIPAEDAFVVTLHLAVMRNEILRRRVRTLSLLEAERLDRQAA